MKTQEKKENIAVKKIKCQLGESEQSAIERYFGSIETVPDYLKSEEPEETYIIEVEK